MHFCTNLVLLFLESYLYFKYKCVITLFIGFAYGVFILSFYDMLGLARHMNIFWEPGDFPVNLIFVIHIGTLEIVSQDILRSMPGYFQTI